MRILFIPKKENRIIVILGKKGAGKSFYANQLVKKEPAVIIDPLNEYRGGIYFFNYEEFEKFDFAIGVFKIILKFKDDEDYSSAFAKVFEVGNCLLLVEEADLFAQSQNIDSNLRKILRYGRHRNIDQIYISRRPYELNRLVTAMADEIVVFRINEQRDLEFLQKYGFNPDEIRSLSNYQHIKKDLTT